MDDTIAGEGPTDETDAVAAYVTNAAWLRPAGRPDTVDDVADQFERRTAAASGAGWPRRSRGWRSRTGWHPHPQEQRVGG